MSNISELACTYATLILHDEGIPITVEKIATLVKEANVEVESYWPSLFAKLATKKNIDDLILNVVSSGAAAPAAMATPAGGVQGTASPSAAVEEKTKEELNEEGDDDDDLGFSLFDD